MASAESDALAVVTQLKELASDPMNRRAIVQDQGCLPGLILFLDHSNPQVVYAALLAIRYLAECRANREKLKEELGMMVSLQKVLDQSSSPGETRLLAAEIFQLLKTSTHAVDAQGSHQAAMVSSCRHRTRFFLGSSNKRAKTVTLQIEGLDDASRRCVCEDALLKVRGVISFTFQMALRRCIIRIRSDLKVEVLAAAISSTQVMKAQQVVKTSAGEEVLVPIAEDGSVKLEQNPELPDYLPEDESPSQEPDKAVSQVGSGLDGPGWLGATTNFLSRSFYW